MKTKLIIAASFVAISIGVYFGFGTHQTTIESYSTEFETYVLAKYSDIDLDTWEQQVSVVWSVQTVRDSLVKYSCPFSLIDGYTCKTPKITISHPKGFDFDKYKKVRDLEYYVDYGDGDFSKVHKKEYSTARLKMHESVTVKTWYGSAYGFELID